MKEKKHYETPRFSVTQVITEGVFAASRQMIQSTVEIEAESHEAGDTFDYGTTNWE